MTYGMLDANKALLTVDNVAKTLSQPSSGYAKCQILKKAFCTYLIST